MHYIRIVAAITTCLAVSFACRPRQQERTPPAKVAPATRPTPKGAAVRPPIKRRNVPIATEHPDYQAPHRSLKGLSLVLHGIARVLATGAKLPAQAGRPSVAIDLASVRLTRLALQGSTLYFAGTAPSEGQLATLMKRLPVATGLRKVKLLRRKQVGSAGRRMLGFELRSRLPKKSPPPPEHRLLSGYPAVLHSLAEALNMSPLPAWVSHRPDGSKLSWSPKLPRSLSTTLTGVSLEGQVVRISGTLPTQDHVAELIKRLTLSPTLKKVLLTSNEPHGRSVRFSFEARLVEQHADQTTQLRGR